MTAIKHASLLQGPANHIGGEWIDLAGVGGRSAGAGTVTSFNPAHPSRAVWSGVCDPSAVDAAVTAARRALPAWSAWGRENRFRVLRRFAEVCKARAGSLAELLCDEIGKVMWEAKGEASAIASKVEITLDTTPVGGLRRVEPYEFDISPQRSARCWYKPHGVLAVLGPYNFPAHLPNGHIVPALAMGNTVVFKPSDKAPGVGQWLIEAAAEALAAEGAPDGGRGVVNLVQGGADVASRLSSHAGVDGLLFTGSWAVGRRILEANLDHPGRIVALEMGGSNPAVVLEDADLKQAAIEIVRCAFNTTGQRCTSTRRAIVHRSVADRLIPAICKAASGLVIGEPRATHPVFMGPIITEQSRRAVLEFQARAARHGAEVLVASAELEVGGTGGWYLTPSVVRVERFVGTDDPGSPHPGGDVEVFGPLLRITVVDSEEEAIEQANATRFGLAAAIFTRSAQSAERFLHLCRAGCINVNTGTAGASSKLPFGGLGISGNHRPAGSFSLDYCAYPVASMLERADSSQLAEGMSFEEDWLA